MRNKYKYNYSENMENLVAWKLNITDLNEIRKIWPSRINNTFWRDLFVNTYGVGLLEESNYELDYLLCSTLDIDTLYVYLFKRKYDELIKRLFFSSQGQDIIIYCAIYGRLDLILYFLPFWKKNDMQRELLIFEAVNINRLDIVKLFLTKKNDIAFYAQACIRAASFNGNLDIVEYFISLGFHITEDNVINAIMGGSLQTLALVLKYCPIRNYFLNQAIYNCRYEIVKYLMSLGAVIDVNNDISVMKCLTQVVMRKEVQLLEYISPLIDLSYNDNMEYILILAIDNLPLIKILNPNEEFYEQTFINAIVRGYFNLVEYFTPMSLDLKLIYLEVAIIHRQKKIFEFLFNRFNKYPFLISYCVKIASEHDSNDILNYLNNY